MTPISLHPVALNSIEAPVRPGSDSRTRRPDAPAASRAPDRVELSDAARQAADGTGAMRLGLVSRVREQIAAGTYETPAKIAIASHELAIAMRGQS